jgi:lipoprotein-anchoring transpeptidase ErfK/SrfK
MTVDSDGRHLWTFPVSLGSAKTPTRHGTKVIMEKLPSVCMHDVANTYYECGVKLDQRLTYDGEYLHAAPWNVYNIEHGIDSSNGCTNLLPVDAQRLYKFLQVGDVVKYPNASGPAMAMGAGYGDWNIPWPVWQQGGIVPT